MSARDDYDPPHASSNSAHQQYDWMCDEIDRLRAEVALLRPESNMVIFAMNELVKELTDHADTLRSYLADTIETIEAEGMEVPTVYQDGITAYDNFIREA